MLYVLLTSTLCFLFLRDKNMSMYKILTVQNFVPNFYLTELTDYLKPETSA